MRAIRFLPISATAVLLSLRLTGATFVVPSDEFMIRSADAIAVGDVLTSHAEFNSAGEIETITEVTVTAVLKGSILTRHIILHEPGGYLAGRAKLIPDVPRFHSGDRIVLFLAKTPTGGWATWNLQLGKFTFAVDDAGNELLVRDASFSALNPGGSEHVEQARLADRFLAYVRDEAAGRTRQPDYLADGNPGPQRRPTAVRTTVHLRAAPNSYTATSYTADVGNGLGARWNVQQGTVQNFYTEFPLQSDAAIFTADGLQKWVNNSGSTIPYAFAGFENCGAPPSSPCHTSGLAAPDNLNTILWERDLTAYGIPAFECSVSGGGVLAIGGVTLAQATSPPLVLNGEAFLTTLEADVEMNQGLIGCFGNFYPGDVSRAIAHEVGHTLGFRHSDQLRIDDPMNGCDTNVLLDCAATPLSPGNAVMQTFLPKGLGPLQLESWDQRAAAAVYPLIAYPAAPTNVVATGTTATNVHVTWTASSAATSYEIWRRDASHPLAAIPNCCTVQNVCSGTTCAYDDRTVLAGAAYLYEVKAVNSGGGVLSAPDVATTVMFTVDNPLCAGNGNAADPPACAGASTTAIQSAHINQVAAAVNALCLLDNNIPCSFTVSSGQLISAGTAVSLRSAVKAARQHLGVPPPVFTDDPLQTPSLFRAVYIRDLRGSVQ